MSKKYFLKLITNEKIFVSYEEFGEWLHRTKGDFIIIQKELATIFIHRENILLGGELNQPDKEDIIEGYLKRKNNE